jgi:hypothetical protein
VLERPLPKPPPPTAQPGRRPRSSTASAAYARAYRQRRKTGQLVVKITIDWLIIDELIAQGFLAAWDEADRRQIARAVQEILTVMSRYSAP